MQQVRFGIVGVGNMGSAHLSHILSGNVPELKVTAVADINPRSPESRKGGGREGRAADRRLSHSRGAF